MTTNNTQFEKGLAGLRKISMAPEKKEAMRHVLARYAEANPAPVTVSVWASFRRFFRNLLLVK